MVRAECTLTTHSTSIALPAGAHFLALRNAKSYRPLLAVCWVRQSGRTGSPWACHTRSDRYMPRAPEATDEHILPAIPKSPYMSSRLSFRTASASTCRKPSAGSQQSSIPAGGVEGTKKPTSTRGNRLCVPGTGVEPARPVGRHPLKMVRLPIPPPGLEECPAADPKIREVVIPAGFEPATH
jgi:hypothetical protein